MNRSGARNRARRRWHQQKLIALAQRSGSMGKETILKERYHDGQLVHDVMRGIRALHGMNLNNPMREVWVTLCGKVLSVDQPKFTWTKKHTTCLECVAGPPKPYQWKVLIP